MLRRLLGFFTPRVTPPPPTLGDDSVSPDSTERRGFFRFVPLGGLGLEPIAPRIEGPPGTVLEKLAAADDGTFATIKLVAQPTSTSPTTATFRLGGPNGHRLRPGEQILLEIPEALRDRPVYQAILEHRQVQAEKSSTPTGEVKKWDATPGVTALHFHTNLGGKLAGWRYWHAPWGASGAQGGKYAEIREDWEAESHFDFHKNGTVSVDKGKHRQGAITIDALRLRSVGKDPTFIKEVRITFAPPKADTVEEHVFSPGTTIGDLLTAEGQAFGKDYEKGTFPGALTLFPGSDGGEGKGSLPPGWSVEDGRLHVPLKPGLTFSGVEIACGDTKPDGVRNTDGAIGTQGHSKLRIGILREGAGQPDWFVEDHGVPPQGVLFGGPKRDHPVRDGDRLVFAVDVDPTYVMALRLSYQESK